MKCSCSFIKVGLQLPVLHKRKTGEQVLRQANGADNWANEGVSIPLESSQDEFLSLNTLV